MRIDLCILALGFIVSAATAGEKDPFDTPFFRGDEPDTVAVGDPATEAFGLGFQGRLIVAEGAGYFGSQRKHGAYIGGGAGSATIDAGDSGGGSGSAASLHFGYAQRSNAITQWGIGAEFYDVAAYAETNIYSGGGHVTHGVASYGGAGLGPHIWTSVGAARGFALHLQYGAAGFGVVCQYRYGHAKKAPIAAAAAPDTVAGGPYVQPKIYGR